MGRLLLFVTQKPGGTVLQRLHTLWLADARHDEQISSIRLTANNERMILLKALCETHGNDDQAGCYPRQSAKRFHHEELVSPFTQGFEFIQVELTVLFARPLFLWGYGCASLSG
eukprot:1160390-Pelagomonas_calceolata.AAC.14